MTPAFWIWVSAFAAAKSATRAARARLRHWGARLARALRARQDAQPALVADEYLLACTGLTRADLDRAFGDPVWSRRSAGLDRAAFARERCRREQVLYYPL